MPLLFARLRLAPRMLLIPRWAWPVPQWVLSTWRLPLQWHLLLVRLPGRQAGFPFEPGPASPANSKRSSQPEKR